MPVDYKELYCFAGGFILVLLNIFPSLLCNLASCAFPAYNSYKAIQSNQNQSVWLYYWIYFACTVVIEELAGATSITEYFPWYYILKYVIACAAVTAGMHYGPKKKKSKSPQHSKTKKAKDITNKYEKHLEEANEHQAKPRAPYSPAKRVTVRRMETSPVFENVTVNDSPWKIDKDSPAIIPPVEIAKPRISAGAAVARKLNFSPKSANRRAAVEDKPKVFAKESKKPVVKRTQVSTNRQPSGANFTKPKSNISMLLDWCKDVTIGYKNVNITNWTTSWWDGLAYCAIIHHYFPDEIDFDSLNPSDKQSNLDLAYCTAERLGVAKLLEAEDFMDIPPERRSNITYITQMYATFTKAEIRKW